MKFTISMVYADRQNEFNTSQFRMIQPGKALGKAGYGVSAIPIQLFQENTKEANDVLEKSHVIIIERNLIGDVLTRLIFWKVRGKVIIGNWDDNYELIEETNISYPYWHNGEAKIQENGEEKTVTIFPHPKEQFIWGIKMLHSATLPSEELMKYYGEKYNVPMYYVPNYFNTEYYINIPKEKRDYITIGWGGSLSHFQSHKDSGILEAFKNIIAVRDNVKIMLCGDKRVYDKLEISEDKKIFQSYVPHEQWGSVVASKFDIGVAPLAGDYDKYRSWIKPIEYCLTSTPWLASDNGVTYSEIKHLEYGKFVQNDVDSWTKALLDTVDNIDEEKEKMKREPLEFGKQQDVNLHAEEIANTYREIALKHAKIDLYHDEPMGVQ